MVTQNQKGSLSIPCLLLLGLVCVAGFGTWGVLRHWRQLMDLQLKIDHCVGKRGLNLKSTLSSLDSSNQRLAQERAAATVATIAPEARAALIAAIEVEFIFQETTQTTYNALLLKEAVQVNCDGQSGRLIHSSPIRWLREPPDDLGAQPFKWQDSSPRFQLEIRGSHGVHSAIETFKGGRGDEELWLAKWTNIY